MAKIQSVNPANNKVVAEYDEMTPDQVKKIVHDVDGAWQSWKLTSFSDRAELMNKAAEVLRKNKSKYAKRMAEEMGKPFGDGEAEVEKCAWVCEYYAEHAEAILAEEVIETDASKSYVTFNPIGVVLAVMPWNFPHWQVWRFVAPALMAGNVGVLKHASNVMGSALDIEEVIKEAGFPDNVFRSLIIGSRQVEAVIKNDHVKAVTLTGSTPAGKAVASAAGSVLKKSVLELGGSDAYVVLSDADAIEAATTCVASRLINGGQSCIAAKRFIVEESKYEEFKDAFVERMKATVMGDPMDPKTNLGPQARHDLRDELHDQVERTVKAGGELLLGGEVPDMDGAYYPATVLGDVKPGMAAFDEELFGPVAAITKASSDEEAIELANKSVFGLGSAVFTSDKAKGEKIAAEQLEAGSAFVNTYVRSDPRLPFGGIKTSGYGRELSHYGIKEFTNIKTVFIA